MPYDSFTFESPADDLFRVLSREEREIWLYGTGNGADKILSVLSLHQIPVSGIFVSDIFFREQIFHGFRVLSVSQFRERHRKDSCVILLAFGSGRPEVLAQFDALAADYPFFVPDVPVCGDTLFDRDFFTAHRKEFSAARALLCDEESLRIFDTVIAAKLTGRYDLMNLAVSSDDIFSLLSLGQIRRMADLGAYTGDTAEEMLRSVPLSFLLAAEPDPHSYMRLLRFANTVSDCEIECHCVAVSDHEGFAPFAASGNRNAGLFAAGAHTENTVRLTTVDSLLCGRPIDYLKFDVEGAEADALAGSAATISAKRPRMRVAAYHRSEDLFALPLLLDSLYHGCRIFLRRSRSMPAWDLDFLILP